MMTKTNSTMMAPAYTMSCAAAINSPPSSKYRTASAPITPMSESALAMGWVCTTRLIPQKTAMPAKMRKISGVIDYLDVRASFCCQSHDEAGDQKVEHRQRKKENPGEAHQLIVTETRQSGAHPDEHEQQHQDFAAEPEQGH